MKYIHKQPEPDRLRNWREKQLSQPEVTNYNYQGLGGRERGADGQPLEAESVRTCVHKALLAEQGWICCYCCQRITQTLSHIEHFDPQGKTKDPNENNPLAVTYSNLLASCGPLPTDPEDPKQRRKYPDHCGDYREDDIIPVSPLDPNCESYFVYNIQTGAIEANLTQSNPVQRQADATITVLNLNAKDLNRMRIEALYPLIEINLQDPAEAALLLESCYQKQPDIDGNSKFDPFCIVVAYWLRTEFNLP